MIEITTEGFFERNKDAITNIAQRLIDDKMKGMPMGVGYFLQLFRLKKGWDIGYYMAVFELEKISLEEVKYKVLRVEKCDDSTEYEELKLGVAEMKVIVEQTYKVIKGN